MKKVLLSCFLFLAAGFFGYAQAGLDKGKVIVIGASSGIGREVARVFHKNGYSVAGLARRQEALESLKQELGDRFVFRVGDVRQDSSRQAVLELIKELGGCDIFVLNAGIWDDSRLPISAEMVDGLDWEKLLQDQLSTIDTNVTGFTRLAAVAFEHFTQQKKGHFVGISSVDAVRGNPGAAVYSSSKAFVSTYMQAMRSLFKQTGFDISVTDIRPGWVETYEIDNKVTWWVEPLPEAAQSIFTAIMKRKKIAYIKARWGLFASYLQIAPDIVYDYLSSKFDIRSDPSLLPQ